jgi:single-strand DNA-binding protein
MNKAILSGRICSDIVTRTTEGGTSVCSFRLAVQRKFKNAEGTYDADFISIVAWRSNADFIRKYFAKGDPIEIGGSIQTRSYEKDNGDKVYITEVVIDEVGFVVSKKDSTQTEKASPLPSEVTQASSFDGFLPMPADDDFLF